MEILQVGNGNVYSRGLRKEPFETIGITFGSPTFSSIENFEFIQNWESKKLVSPPMQPIEK